MKFRIVTAGVGLVLGLSLNANAVPTLQLDASPATYNSSLSATVSTSDQFTLYALLKTKGFTFTPGCTFDIVAAVTPKQAIPADLGSFVFNGQTVKVTGDMVYGTPSGLPSHGIYSTYYHLFQFTWDSANTFTDYDAASVTGDHTGPTYNASGKDLYMAFDVDVTGLSAGNTLWFDLVEEDASGKVICNAPFSHSADVRGGGGLTAGGSPVPDGGVTAMLLGAGVTVIGALRRRFKS